MEADDDRFDRQKRIAGWNQEAVEQQKIMVVGAGALGNEVVKLLLQIGVKKIALVDYDSVVKANLNRCLFFSEEDAKNRVLKVEAIAREARKIAADAQIKAIARNVEELPEDAWNKFDFVFSCLDNLGARIHINAHSYGKAVLIDGGTTGFMGKVQVVRAPSSCLECGLSKRDYAFLWRKYNCVGEVVDWIDPKMPALATTTSIIASIQVNEFMKICHGLKSLEGKYLFFDGLSGQSKVYEVMKR
ncbi:MAG: ThiF family adenylyltransferase, partial [Candidatus Norongarragalinales archaeon]